MAARKKTPQKRSSNTSPQKTTHPKTVKKPTTKVKAKEPALTPEIVEEPEYSITDISQLPPKQAAFALLKENGLKAKDISKMVGYTQGTGYVVNAKLNKFKLTNTKMVKSAHNAVKNILAGESWGSIKNIKDSSALAAAAMVYDRIDPVKRDVEGSTNISFTQINLEISNSGKGNDNK